MKNVPNLLGFKTKGENCYSLKKQQWFFAVGGGVGLLLSILGPIVIGFENNSMAATLTSLPITLVGGAISVFLTVLGLFRVETEINLNTRKASITRKNFRGQKSTREFNLDDIGITAIHFGRAGGAGGVGVSSGPHWVVKAGFQTEDYDTAIYSQEVPNEEERNKVMLDLYRFFFPDDTRVSESNIKADGNKAVLQKPA
jgi:hypothetical protein